MSDLISRAAAIDAVVGCTNCRTEDELRAYVTKHYLDNGWTGGIVDALDVIEQLPPAEPEHKRGFWWAIEKGEKGYSAGNFRCSVCGEPNASYIPKPNFCPNCGADMKGGLNERSD